jgi:hypothetical protein
MKTGVYGLKPIQDKWYRKIEVLVRERNKYFITNRFNRREAAVSTFVGVEINFTQSEILWRSLIVGDSCLLHIGGDGKLKKSYLFENSKQFTSKPEFFASYARDNRYEPTFFTGSLGEQDVLLLVSDAFAKWLLQQNELGQKAWATAWHALLKLNSPTEFEKFIDDLRQSTSSPLDNDDVTVLLVYIHKLSLPENNYLLLTHDDKAESSISLPNDSDITSTELPQEDCPLKVEPPTITTKKPNNRNTQKKYLQSNKKILF